jgi:hypothetical protein
MPISESFRSKMRKSATVTCVSSVALAGFMFSVPVANAAEYQADTTWGSNGQINLSENYSSVYEPGLDSANNLYIVNNAQSGAGVDAPDGITKYNAQGQIDVSWGANGFLELADIVDIQVLGDGTIYALTDTTVNVYSADGALVSSFDISDVSGLGATNVAVTPEGEIVVAVATQIDFADTNVLYKLSATGDIVNDFGTNGLVNLGAGTLNDVAVTADGSIYVASAGEALAKFSAAGITDDGFVADVTNAGTELLDLQASPTDNSVYVKGNAALVKVSPTGAQEAWNDGDGFADATGTVFALNAAGDLYVANQTVGSTYSKLVTVADVAAPSQPTNVTFTNIAERSATVNWEAPVNTGGSDVTGYDVQYRAVGATDWLLLDTLPGTARSANLTGLTGETGYEVSITATNATGTGAAAGAVFNTAAAQADVITAPTSLSVVSEQSGQATFVWAAPAVPEGVTITGYEVQYRLDGGDTAVTNRTVAANTTEFSATGLENLSKYNFSVRTLTSAGASQFSPGVVITPFEFAPVANYTDTREEAGVQQVPGSTIKLTPSNVNDLLPVGATVNLKLVNAAGVETLIGSQVVGADGGYDLTGTIPADYATGNATLLAEVAFENSVRQAVEESLVVVAAESAPDPNAPVVGGSGDNGGVAPADNGTTPIASGGDTGVIGENGSAAPTYANCDAAAAAGLTNFESTDRNLDSDGDGIACEVAGGPQNASALAYTGTDGTSSLIGAGLLLLGAGAGLGAISLKRRKKYESFLPSNIS